MKMIRAAILLASALLTASALSAQDERIDTPWRLSYFPYLTLSPNDGVMGIARMIYFQQADWGGRLSLQSSVAVEAGYSTRDAWLGRVTWSEPLLAPGWRMKVHAEAGHRPRFGDPDEEIGRKHAEAWVEVTRRVTGPLHLAMRGAVQHETMDLTMGQRDRLYPGLAGSFPPLPAAPGLPVELIQTAVSARAALVVDLRDREFEINSGMLAELGGFVGSAADQPDGSFLGLYGHLRGWATPMERTRITGRAGFRLLPYTDALAPRHELPQWEMPFTTTGGPQSHRGLAIGEKPGRGLLLAGLEGRYDVLNMGELGAITVLGFADGARVFSDPPILTGCIEGSGCFLPAGSARDDGDLRLTTKGWDWSIGGGIALRVLRAATLNVTAASSDHGTRWYISSGWAW